MADRMIVDASDVVAFSKGAAGALPILFDEMRIAGERSIKQVEGQAKGFAPVRQGTLRRSITSETRSLGGIVTAVAGSNLPYAKPIEGLVPQTFPPSWRIALASGRGVKFTQYLTRALRELKPLIAAEFARVPARTIARLRGGR